MAKLKRTTSEDPDFQGLVRLLDHDLAGRDGEEQHAFYAQFNKIDGIRHAVVYYRSDTPVGCGAFKPFETGVVEIKRMYVQPGFRGQRIAAIILKELEQWAAELNYAECVLETGKNNPEALRLYQREGYALMPNFGQYKNDSNSVCMKKAIQQLSSRN